MVPIYILNSLLPIVAEIANRHPDVMEQDYNPEYALEITLTVEEMRAVITVAQRQELLTGEQMERLRLTEVSGTDG